MIGNTKTRIKLNAEGIYKKNTQTRQTTTTSGLQVILKRVTIKGL